MKQNTKEYRSQVQDLQLRIKQLEDALDSKKDELTILKSVFLKHIPHEIRTPMNSILGFSTLLAEGRLKSEQRREYLKYISAASEELLQVIENLIDLAMLQSGQVEIQSAEFLIKDLFEELFTKFTRDPIYNQKKNIEITYTMPDDANQLEVIMDRQRLKQVLSHLIHNAMKFTNKGIVEFGCHKDDGGYMGFFVKDSGPGIRDDNRALLFNSFNKQFGPPSERNRGIGVGLSIAKGMVECMGGRLSYTPNLECGSVFSFSLPITLVDIKKRPDKSCYESVLSSKEPGIRKDLAI